MCRVRIEASGEYESMKSRETLIRLRKFQVDEKRRRVAQIESMVADFDRMAADLDREIATEQDRAGIHDPAHFAYPTYAKAAITRRDNLEALGRRTEDPARRRAPRARRGLRGTQEGRAARRARPGARARRRECARPGRDGPHRRDAACGDPRLSFTCRSHALRECRSDAMPSVVRSGGGRGRRSTVSRIGWLHNCAPLFRSMARICEGSSRSSSPTRRAYNGI